MRKLIFIAILLLFSMSMLAQTVVSGSVTDAKTSDPLPGVNIKIVGKTLGTTTDFDGNFTLKTNQAVPFEVVVSTLGYTSQTVAIANANQTVTVALAENATSLDEVIVSASRTPESVRESPVTVERMDVRDIKNAAGPNFYSSIENLKGVDVNTSSLTFNSINTRGFATYANARFVQLIDGMDNASPALNFVLGNLTGINELDVKSVELLPGASSALYGANAFNGILFMTSKNPFDYQGISFYAKKGITSSEAGGANPYHDVGIRAAHAFSEKFAAKASFSYLEGTDWQATDENGYVSNGAGFADTIIAPGASGHNAINIYGDEVASNINDVAKALEALNILPPGANTLVPSVVVGRRGYKESDLTDYKAKSVKFDASLNYRPNGDDLEVVWNSRIGLGNTIYQGTDRYQLKDFTMTQHKLEVRNDDFFVRGYMTSEDAGNSYDMNFAGINMVKNGDEGKQWLGLYTGTYFQSVFLHGATDTQAHAAAQANADATYPRLEPGTPEFQARLDKILADPDVKTGAKFVDDTKMYVGEGNYNFKSLLNNVLDLQVGGSYRQYELNSSGTIFTDANGVIDYGEYGAYVQAIKKFNDDRIKVAASARYDKAQNFDGNISPRVSVNYATGENRQHNIRASFQTGFRNPTTQDQYIGLNAGPIILVGSAEDNLDKPLSGSSATGRDAYFNAYTLTSVQAFGVSHNPADLVMAGDKGVTSLVQPEKVTAYDLGYRGKLGKIVVDVNGYFNAYEGFISSTRVVSPLGGLVTDMTGVLALAGGNSQAFSLYTNSKADISSYGVSIGLSTRFLDNYKVGLSYTYAKLDFDQTTDPNFRAGFNTPPHKVKVSFGNPKLFKNFGFNVNARWNDQYLWEATAASGVLDARTIVDAQINYSLPKLKSTFKLGAANLGGTEYKSSIGGGSVGSQYYLSWTINN